MKASVSLFYSCHCFTYHSFYNLLSYFNLERCILSKSNDKQITIIYFLTALETVNENDALQQGDAAQVIIYFIFLFI